MTDELDHIKKRIEELQSERLAIQYGFESLVFGTPEYKELKQRINCVEREIDILKKNHVDRAAAETAERQKQNLSNEELTLAFLAAEAAEAADDAASVRLAHRLAASDTSAPLPPAKEAGAAGNSVGERYTKKQYSTIRNLALEREARLAGRAAAPAAPAAAAAAAPAAPAAAAAAAAALVPKCPYCGRSLVVPEPNCGVLRCGLRYLGVDESGKPVFVQLNQHGTQQETRKHLHPGTGCGGAVGVKDGKCHRIDYGTRRF